MTCPPAPELPLKSPHPAAKPLALMTVLALLSLAPPAQAQTATEAELMRRLDQMATELAQLKVQLGALQQQRAAATPVATAAAALAAPPAATAAPARATTTATTTGTVLAAAPAAAPVTAAVADAQAAPSEPATVLSSYGEINYQRPRNDIGKTRADLVRFVLGYQRRFDDKTKVLAELEVEHAVSSASDAGEVAVEQAYVEHQVSPTWGLRAGLFLLPMGLLNENHEPTAFYGVERNFVETRIIPTTWREGGVQLMGQFDNGLTLQGGVTTGFDLNKWDAKSTEGLVSPLGSIHQELALAQARDLSLFGALNWRGVPGLLLGGGVFSGGASQGQTSTSSRVTLWDLHGRWTPGRWDLSALYSRATISNTAALNAALVGSPTLIPASFDGAYVQAAYRLWQRGSYQLAPFVRWEQFNTASRYADLGPGLTPSARPAERVVTLGANFQLTPGIVLKADLQRFKQDHDADRFDLGIGWSF
jgi:hypothetical protein